MRLTTQREQLIRPLQSVIGVVERRQTLPILSNVLITAKEEQLTCTATDLEVELTARSELPAIESGSITLPARKFLDILRALPEGAEVTLVVEGEKALIRCCSSRFSLVTLPAADFPTLEDFPVEGHTHLSQTTLKRLIEHTHFAMAQQDVRYYLNGLLLDIHEDKLRAVATDGHRLAFCEVEVRVAAPIERQVIVPRKGVQELNRLLNGDEMEAVLKLGANHLRVEVSDICFTSKLIDGKFPDYQRVIPQQAARIVTADRLLLRSALSRAAILSNEKYRGVRLQLEEGLLHIQTHNPEQEEAFDTVEVNYSGDPLEIGFNVSYLLDALGALSADSITLSFTDSSSSCLIQAVEEQSCQYVVMPMRL